MSRVLSAALTGHTAADSEYPGTLTVSAAASQVDGR